MILNPYINKFFVIEAKKHEMYFISYFIFQWKVKFSPKALMLNYLFMIGILVKKNIYINSQVINVHKVVEILIYCIRFIRYSNPWVELLNCEFILWVVNWYFELGIHILSCEFILWVVNSYFELWIHTLSCEFILWVVNSYF